MTDILRTLSSLFSRELPGKREQLAQVGSTARGEVARTRIAALAIGSKSMDIGKWWADIAMVAVSHRRTTDGELNDMTEAVIDDIHSSIKPSDLESLKGRNWILRNMIYDELRRHATGDRDSTPVIEKARAARMRTGSFIRLQRAVIGIVEGRLDEVASNMNTRT